MTRLAVVLVLLLAGCDLFRPAQEDPFPSIRTPGLERIAPRESWETIYPSLKACARELDEHVINLSDGFEVLDWYTADSACRDGKCGSWYSGGDILIDRNLLTRGDRQSLWPAELDALWTATHEMSHHFTRRNNHGPDGHSIFKRCRADSIWPERFR